ncbi:MAG: hypothetical protein KC454_08330, partial [Flavobacteriales bacterium]|nr:hypothetical protein [Flavobacteriales bacterium]
MLACLIIPMLILAIAAIIVHQKQDAIVNEIMIALNEDFTGSAEISDSHISFFENFPYVSIDLENFKVYETKEKSNKPLIDIEDVFAGFNLWTVVTGKMEIKKIKIQNGHIDIVQHLNGEFNIVKALSSKKEIEDPGEEFHLDLKKIELENIDITKLNEENNLKVEAFVSKAKSKFKSSENSVHASLNAQFVLNLIKGSDTTFLKQKHIDLDSEVDYFKDEDLLNFQPTEIHMEGSEFGMEGGINFKKNIFLDLIFTGKKPNFDLLIAFAPEEQIPTLKSYKNKGELFIQANIKGESINGHNPDVKIVFNCKNGEIINRENGRTLKDINFSGFYTNGKKQ